MNIGLVPLDERPVNTRYPAMIAAIAGATLTLPPTDILSMQRRPADCAALGEWLISTAPRLDALIVSCEMLGYGGLIASRIGDDPPAAILARLDVLRTLKYAYPALPILGFNVVTRVSNADDAVEEPTYWQHYGTRLYQFGQLLDRQRQGQNVADEIDALLAAIPASYRLDWLRRRARNHAVNLGMLHLLADGVFDLLVLSSDDTSPYGLPSREKCWLTEWGSMLELDDRLLMYPGADEVGCVLVARLLNAQHNVVPRFQTVYAPPEAAHNVAAYEDGPISVTVERHVRAVGGVVVQAEADFWLGVNAPLPRRAEWQPDFAEQERTDRLSALETFIAQAAQRQAVAQPVIIADVAYPNGADPALIELLQAHIDLPTLAAYGAWNTAGNTIGTALAQACAARLIATSEQRAAHERFLLHRFVEDWGYQHVVRAELRQQLQQETGHAELTATNLTATLMEIEARFHALINELPGFAGRYGIVPNSVRLPWKRLFEVDFELTSK